VGFTTGSRGEVTGKTKPTIKIIITIIMIIMVMIIYICIALPTTFLL
jgi:hypothetical protein